MQVTLVQVKVKAEAVDAFIQATRENHEKSVLESGNARFDVLQDPQDPTRFILYEAYADEALAKAHKETDHYLKWRDLVADMMAQPRHSQPMIGLFPRLD